MPLRIRRPTGHAHSQYTPSNATNSFIRTHGTHAASDALAGEEPARTGIHSMRQNAHTGVYRRATTFTRCITHARGTRWIAGTHSRARIHAAAEVHQPIAFAESAVALAARPANRVIGRRIHPSKPRSAELRGGQFALRISEIPLVLFFFIYCAALLPLLLLILSSSGFVPAARALLPPVARVAAPSCSRTIPAWISASDVFRELIFGNAKES